LNLCNVDNQRETKVPGEQQGLMLDHVPHAAFSTVGHADVDGERRYIGTDELIQVTMTQLHQLHTPQNKRTKSRF